MHAFNLYYSWQELIGAGRLIQLGNFCGTVLYKCVKIQVYCDGVTYK